MRTLIGFVGLALLMATPAFVVPVGAQVAGPMSPGSAQTRTSKSQATPGRQDSASQKRLPRSDRQAAGESRKPSKIKVPTGTHIPLVLHNAISTRTAHRGDPVYFETSFPVLVDGRVVIPAGSYVSGEVTEAKRPGRVHGRGQLMIRLTTMILPNDYVVNLNAVPGGSPGTGGNETVNNEGKIVGDSDKGGDLGTVIHTTAESTGVGAAVGAAAGNVGRGAGIGAGVGAAAGLAEVLLSRGPEAELPRGTTLDAVLDHALYLDASKVQFKSPGVSSPIAGPPNREPRRERAPF